jgi:hypothetical protein
MLDTKANKISCFVVDDDPAEGGPSKPYTTGWGTRIL